MRGGGGQTSSKHCKWCQFFSQISFLIDSYIFLNFDIAVILNKKSCELVRIFFPICFIVKP